MHQPKAPREAGTCFWVRGLAPPDMLAAAATACSTSAKGSLPAATYRALRQEEPSTLTSPDSMRMNRVSPPSVLPGLHTHTKGLSSKLPGTVQWHTEHHLHTASAAQPGCAAHCPGMHALVCTAPSEKALHIAQNGGGAGHAFSGHGKRAQTTKIALVGHS